MEQKKKLPPIFKKKERPNELDEALEKFEEVLDKNDEPFQLDFDFDFGGYDAADD